MSQTDPVHPEQFSAIDLACEPPRWSSNDERFWRPVKDLFKL
jgi:hypothetical protein